MLPNSHKVLVINKGFLSFWRVFDAIQNLSLLYQYYYICTYVRCICYGPIYNRWSILKPAGLFQSRLARFKASQQFNCAIYAVVYLRDMDDQAYGNALSHVVDAAE